MWKAERKCFQNKRNETKKELSGEAHGGGEEERQRSVRVFFEMYSQNLQIAQRSESSIFDAADVVAVQLPAPQTHTYQAHKKKCKRTRTHRDKGEGER